jgi:hypothetical protein
MLEMFFFTIFKGFLLLASSNNTLPTQMEEIWSPRFKNTFIGLSRFNLDSIQVPVCLFVSNCQQQKEM